MKRRLLFLLPFAARLRAEDAADQVVELLGLVVSRLADGNAPGLMEAFDKSMPGYEELQANVAGLLAQELVQSSLDILRNDGTDTVRTVEIDWLMQLTERQDTGAVTRRRETVTCRVEKAGRKWKIFALAPQSLFAPVRITG